VILLDNRGQAYSTFKLLIAAIVALAILMILTPIIGSVLQIFQDDPAAKTIELLNDLYNRPGAIKTTARDVTFSPGTPLSAVSLAQSIPLSKEQICLSTGDFEDSDTGFSLDEVGGEHHRIIWNGTANRNVKIAVMCHINLDSLEQELDNTLFEDFSPDCGICEGEGRCCIVALTKP